MKNFADRPAVLDDGTHISRRIFSDQEIYRREMDRVFRKGWLFLAMADRIPNAGDYFTTYMGEDSVVAVRDKGGQLRAFLNTCPHRGNRVCMFDAGNAASFTCSYHGWSFSTEGKLIGVPFFEEAYNGKLDRENLGLIEVPCVADFSGMIFGSWDPNVPSIRTYLGDFAFYLEKLFLASDMGGVETLPGTQRYRMPGNWKLIADNFAGDHYHTHTTHASARVGIPVQHIAASDNTHGYFEIELQPAHGLGGVYTNTAQYEGDLKQAEAFGPEVVAWVKDRYARLQRSIADVIDKPYGFVHANAFPNLSFLWGGSILAPRGVYIWHPKGPLVTEAWQWCVVERDTPLVIRKLLARKFTQVQAAAGAFAADDTENFERLAANTASPGTQNLTFHYGMTSEYDGHWPTSETWHTKGLPGRVGPRFTEMNQRLFYRHWQHLMEAPV